MRKRIFFWILLSIFSTALAEVSIANSPVVFFNGYGLIFVLPLYGLHILFLAALSMPSGKAVRFSSLIFAGALFGLYEAYITKVLWVPTWEMQPWRVMEVNVPTFLMLVFFYHTWMSFLLPLLLAEHFTCAEKRIFQSLPGWLQHLFHRRGLWLGVVAFFGMTHGVMIPNLGQGLRSILGTSLLMLIFLLGYRRWYGSPNDPIPNLLPRGKTVWLLGFLLMLFYWFFLFNTRPEILPGWQGHTLILAAYLFFGLLLWLSIRRAGKEAPDPEIQVRELPSIWKPWLLGTGLFLACSIMAMFYLKELQPMIYLLLWGAGIPFGLYCFYTSVRQLSPKKVDLSTTFPV